MSHLEPIDNNDCTRNVCMKHTANHNVKGGGGGMSMCLKVKA